MDSPNMPAFNTWKQGTLVDFAEQSYRKLCEQEQVIEQLRRDLKDALAQCRQYMRGEHGNS